MQPATSQPHAAVDRFDGRHPERYLNPRLPFGSAALPVTPFSFTVRDDSSGQLYIDYRWQPNK
jgi:hypothetical protein